MCGAVPVPDSYFAQDWTLNVQKSQYLREDDWPPESNP